MAVRFQTLLPTVGNGDDAMCIVVASQQQDKPSKPSGMVDLDQSAEFEKPTPWKLDPPLVSFEITHFWEEPSLDNAQKS
jgi:hypothetical protein